MVGPRCTVTPVGGTSQILIVLFSLAPIASERQSGASEQQPGGEPPRHAVQQDAVPRGPVPPGPVPPEAVPPSGNDTSADDSAS